MTRSLVGAFVVGASLLAVPLAAQVSVFRPDSIAVVGLRRTDPRRAIADSRLVADTFVTYRDVQRAIELLYATGAYQEVGMYRDSVGTKDVLFIRLRERPTLSRWTLKGVVELSEPQIRDKIQLVEGRPLDPAALARAEARMDSMYRTAGYYLAEIKTRRLYDLDSSHVRLIFDVTEGPRVAISQVNFDGNLHYSAQILAAQMHTRPEGFWWFRSGEYDDDALREDLYQRLPAFYGSQGYVDFQVLGDTVVVDDTTGKASLVVRINEGDRYRIGSFEIAGNRRFSTSELDLYYPFATAKSDAYFDQQKWQDAVQNVQSLYFNNGYIYMTLRPEVVRKKGSDGAPMVDLRWSLQEQQPATINRVDVVGNDVTHENVIRDAILVLPGDVFRQDALVRSYQNISNLGFFEEPLPLPDTKSANDAGDVDVIFHVTEKHTGTVNFGASLGQGTGVGGFLSLTEPNLFGQGKQGQLQWMLGADINEFNVSYTDPSILESRISGTVNLHDYQVNYTIANLGTLRTRGASLRFGIPAFHDHYTRLFAQYGLDVQSFNGASTNQAFAAAFSCNNCLSSNVTATIMRDTRIDLPFATAGSLYELDLTQGGGPLGGTGNYQKIDLQTSWFAPLGGLGSDPLKQVVRFVLGLEARSGYVFGYAPFFSQLYTMGGTQYGIPLPGYYEFSITPTGYDPNAQNGVANPGAFGKAFMQLTAQIGMRISQAFYVHLFSDEGNVWARAEDFNPTNLLRGAGIGFSVVSPLGPLGLDLAYGFDRVDALGNPAPGWKVDVQLGNTTLGSPFSSAFGQF